MVHVTDADGYQLRMMDPYGNPELRVRTPESEEEHVYTVRALFLSAPLVTPCHCVLNADLMVYEPSSNEMTLMRAN